MENQQSTEGPPKKFRLFAVKKIIIGTVGVLALLLIASYVLNLYENHDTGHGDTHEKTAAVSHAPSEAGAQGSESEAEHTESSPGQKSHSKAAAGHDEHEAEAESHQTSQDADTAAADEHDTGAAEKAHAEAEKDDHAADHDNAHEAPEAGHEKAHEDTHAAADHGDAHEDTHTDAGHEQAPKVEAHAAEDDTHAGNQADAGHGDAHGGDHGDGHGGGHMTIPVSDVKGVTFVMATIAPLRYELEERFFGWQPNDILRPTDNDENFQLGVLEVTRRTVEALTERISRTGSAQAFDTDLEKARNNLMINADDYMMPSAEASYTEALDALERYRVKLEKGSAPFFTRTVNLIPLLESFESLLGSCDDNLVKAKEDDGSKVSWFRADDYFYYAQGVAKAMHMILQAVAVDFSRVIESRRGEDVLHHAIEALHHAMAIEPLIILDGDPDGFTANHRANLAAPISHARFYVGLLIQTLTT